MSVMENSLPRPTGVTIALNRVMPSGNGAPGDPAIAFESDPTVGWYMNDNGDVVFTSGMDDTMLQNSQYTEFKKPIMFNEFDPAVVDLANRGILYKKSDDPGLWWLTESGEINLADGGRPPTMRMSQGTSAQPTFTFGSDCNSGMFLDSPGNVGISARGIEVLRVNKEMMKVFKPIEIMDSSISENPRTSLTGYLYKKAGEDGLWWRSSNGEVDLTAGLPDALLQPRGSAKSPTYSFAEDPVAGLFLIEPGRIGLGVNSKPKLEIKNSEIVADVALRVPNGALGMPGVTFANSVKTGLFSTQSGHISFAAEGSKVLDVSQSTVQTLVPMKVPSLVLAVDDLTGVSGSKNKLDLNVGGVCKAYISHDGLHVQDLLSLEKGIILQQNGIQTMNGALHFTANGRGIMHTDAQGLHADAPVYAKQGYFFENEISTGVSLEGPDLALYSENGSIKLKNKVELSGQLQLPTGSLFTKKDQYGLYWQTPNGEVDLTTRGLAALPQKMDLPAGSAAAPTYSFASAQGTGLSMVSGKLVQSIAGKPVVSTDEDSMHISGKLKLRDSANVDIQLYKKATSQDLFARLATGDEVNLTTPVVNYPIQVPVGKSVAFGNFELAATVDGVKLANALSVSPASVKVDAKLEIKEQLQAVPSDAEHGVLYKEKGSGNLIWAAGNTQHNLTRELTEFKATGISDFKRPEFSFKNDLDTGLSKVEDNVVGMVAGGQLAVAAASDQVMIYKPMALMDSAYNTPVVNSEGRLYKKTGSAGLFWSTVSGEVDLTQQEFPLIGHNGNAMTPTYAFNEQGYGMFKLGDAVGISAGSHAALYVRKDETQVNGKLKLSHDGHTGLLSVRAGKLFWDETDLCNGMKYPIQAPDGTQLQPSYSFAGDSSLGITRVGSAVSVVSKGSAIAQFTSEKTVLPTVSTRGVTLENQGSSGMLINRGLDLVWKPVGGADVVLGSTADAFNGGIISEDLDAPGLVLRDIRLSQDNSGKFDVSYNSQSMMKVSPDGLQTRGLRLTATSLKDDLNGILSIDSHLDGPLMRLSKNRLDIVADTVGIADGSLSKSGDSLIWQTDLGPVDLTDKSVVFPLRAPLLLPNNDIAYGYEGSNVGIAKDGTALVLKSENAYVVVEDDGYLTSVGINTGQICAADGLTIHANGSPTKLTKDKLETSGVFRGKKDGITFGYDVTDYSVGIIQSGGGLGLVSGKVNPAVLTDSSLNIKQRNIAFNDATLERKGADLYWKLGTSEVQLTKPHETWYRETLTYTAYADIKQGDIVCMDPNGTGKICKGIGGRIQKIPTVGSYTGNCKAMTVYDYDSTTYVLCFTKVKMIGSKTQIVAVFVRMMKDSHMAKSTYEVVLTAGEYTSVGVLEDGYGKIIQIDADTYVVPYLKPGENYVRVAKIYKPFSLAPTRSTLDVHIGVVCESMTAEYDSNNDCLVVVCHSSTTQNFAVALISAGRDTDEPLVGTVETTLSTMSVADINKQIHLVLVPGGTCIVSYGIMKLVFIISSYQGSITPGDTFMDYESVDCAGMFYDSNHGVIMTLEKTVSGSCYVQILDVLGIAIQKLTSRGFNNANIEPLGLAYNVSAGGYAMLYATGPSGVPVYVQNFDFDGELLTFGLRYQDTNGTYDSNGQIKHEKNLFEIPGTKLFIYGYDPNTLAVFEAGYYGNPAGYIGTAIESSAANQQCSIVVKGHIYLGSTQLPNSWLGKKLYIVDPNKDYPECLSTSPANGVFYGTCLDPYRILLGL